MSAEGWGVTGKKLAASAPAPIRKGPQQRGLQVLNQTCPVTKVDLEWICEWIG